MRRFSRLIPFALAALVVFAPATSTMTHAQGGGGIIIEGTVGTGPENFNPVLCLDQGCLDILRFLLPSFVGVDKNSTFQKGAAGALVTDWKISDDLKTYTFTLRKDMKWTDGVTVTSADYLYSWNALKDPDVKSPFSFLTADITDVKAPDPQTVVVTFASAQCNSLTTASSVPIAPAHALGDPKKLETAAYNTNPSVTSGVFKFGEFRPADQTSLVADQSYPDKIAGTVKPDGYIYKIVGDQAVEVQQFLNGDLNVIDSPAVSSRADIRKQADAGTVKIYSYPGENWDYISFNLADPKNPQPALDKDGKPVDQGHHPVLGDKAVRQAIARIVDVDTIIKGAVFGEGTRLASSYLPRNWAFDKDLKPIALDVAAAKKLLDDAGWKDVGADGIRVAKGSKFAPDGTRLSFKLIAPQTSTRRVAIGNIAKDELKQVGIEVDFQPLEFNTFLKAQQDQTGDAFIGSWGGGDPNNADQTQFWDLAGDQPGAGTNFTSYNNPELLDLMEKANTLPGCDQTERAKLYKRIQAILQDDLPYLFLDVQNGFFAARSNVDGFAPNPGQLYWNVDAWNISAK